MSTVYLQLGRWYLARRIKIRPENFDQEKGSLFPVVRVRDHTFTAGIYRIHNLVSIDRVFLAETYVEVFPPRHLPLQLSAGKAQTLKNIRRSLERMRTSQANMRSARWPMSVQTMGKIRTGWVGAGTRQQKTHASVSSTFFNSLGHNIHVANSAHRSRPLIKPHGKSSMDAPCVT